MDAFCFGRFSNLANNTLVCKRRWPGRYHRSFAHEVRNKLLGQFDGLLLLPQHLGGGANYIFCQQQTFRSAADVAGAVWSSLPFGTPYKGTDSY